jgi:ketosteroid isomerase-like protein
MNAVHAVAASSADENRPVADVQAVLRAQEAAWNRGDIDGFMNGYARSNDTTFVSGGKVTRGWQTVRDRYKKKYDTREKMGTLTFSDLHVTVNAPDAANAIGKWQLRRAHDTPHGRFNLLFKRTADGWRIVRDETTSATP